MKSLVTVLIVDIDAGEYKDSFLDQLGQITPVVQLLVGRDYNENNELEGLIKEVSANYEYVMILRLGDQLSHELIEYISEFIKSNNLTLAVNYVNRYGFNTEPRIWSKRVLITQSQDFGFDGYQLLQSRADHITYTDFEVYNNLGTDLKRERLKYIDLTSFHIYSKVSIMDDWFALRQYPKGMEVAHSILSKNLNPQVRYYVLNQLSHSIMQDQNARLMDHLIQQYSEDIKQNPLVLADYFFVHGQYKNVLETLDGYTEPNYVNSGLPYDRERYRAYVYYLQAQSYLLMGQLDEATKTSTLFFEQSVVLRHQIKWVKLLRSHINHYENKVVNSRPPSFALVSQPRTGSTWLQTLINSHSQITCFGELLAINKPRLGEGNSVSKSVGELVQQREQNVIGFLDGFFGAGGNGFKLHLFQLDEYEKHNIWPWLLDNGSTKVIYLKRRDVVATYISFLLASQNNYWQTQREDSRVFDTVTVNLLHFRTYMEKMKGWEDKYMSQVNWNSLMVVYYEDLLSGEYALNEIQSFLGVEIENLQGNVVLQRSKSLIHIVSNLKQVVEFYHDNPIYK